MTAKDLDAPPAELMVVEDDESHDPYNSGIRRKLKETDVVFVRGERILVGDTTTETVDIYRRKK